MMRIRRILCESNKYANVYCHCERNEVKRSNLLPINFTTEITPSADGHRLPFNGNHLASHIFVD